MKFKIGDKVRLKREQLATQAKYWNLKSHEILWWEIDRISGNDIYWPNTKYTWYEEWCLKLATEESEFERWEIVEVYNTKQGNRVKGIFICEIPWALYPYICVNTSFEKDYLNWKQFCFTSRDQIRKFKSKLTRQEIAKKFLVNEDFELIED